MYLKLRDLEELRVLTAALLADRAPASASEERIAEAEEMDPLVDKLLTAAEKDGFGADSGLVLDDAECQRLVEAVEVQLDAAAESGDLFLVGDLEAVLRKLGRAS
ncbi:MAG: hypothetical protein VKO21_02735 [Candidatus Sericytochromatia bacterium]|nr:hypothetical protein [Candidatus Sericytochromatia bacterium]